MIQNAVVGQVLVRRLLSIVEETVQKAAFNELGGLLLQVGVENRNVFGVLVCGR